MTRRTRTSSFILGAYRARIAAFCVLFFVISGFAHAVFHASAPVPNGITQVTAFASETANDDKIQIEVEGNRCLACAPVSIPVASVTTGPSVAFTMVVAKPTYQVLQQRLHADPPPPKA